jgi:biotin operon repressor
MTVGGIAVKADAQNGWIYALGLSPRRALRKTVAFTLDRLNEGRALFDGDFGEALIFAAITTANVAHIDDDEFLFSQWSALDTPPPNELRRPVSGYKISFEVALPRETVRRRTNSLLARGVLIQTADGFCTPTEAHASTAFTTYAHHTAVAAAEYFRAMEAIGKVSRGDLELAAVGPVRPRMITRASHRLTMAVIEAARRITEKDTISTALFLAVLINTLNGKLPGSKATAGPLSAVALSHSIGLPRETVRRHVRKMLDQGLLAYLGHGLVVPDETLKRSRTDKAFNIILEHAEAFVSRCAMAGVAGPINPS